MCTAAFISDGAEVLTSIDRTGGPLEPLRCRQGLDIVRCMAFIADGVVLTSDGAHLRLARPLILT